MSRRYTPTAARQAETYTADCPEHGAAPFYKTSRHCVCCTQTAAAKTRKARGQIITDLRAELAAAQAQLKELEPLRAKWDSSIHVEMRLKDLLNNLTSNNPQPDLIGE